MKFLILEPSSATRILVKHALADEGTLEWVETLAQARSRLASERYDAVVAAAKLADGSALELLASEGGRVGRPGGVGAMILIADEADPAACEEALERGADDFIATPLHAAELRARVRARTRLAAPLARGGIEVDVNSRIARFEGRDLELTGREFGILSTLMRHEGSVVGREALIAAVWGSAVLVMDRTVSTHVYTLRKKLGPVAAAFIQSEPGAGYRFSPSAALAPSA
jgi:DNA-binding response OmpR family regulator